jgi:nitroreductase
MQDPSAVAFDPNKLTFESLESYESELSRAAIQLITSRQNVSPKRLIAPGPNDDQVAGLFQAAAAAPDHGEITPWRFVLVPVDKRELLADAFAQALLGRDSQATDAQVETAREKAFRAPFVALAIARLGPSDPDIDPLERLVSVGAAIQNILLAAHSMGFGCGLTSGQAMRSNPIRHLFGMVEGEQAICCINIGTVSKRKPVRLRADVSSFVSSLDSAEVASEFSRPAITPLQQQPAGSGAGGGHQGDVEGEVGQALSPLATGQRGKCAQRHAAT